MAIAKTRVKRCLVAESRTEPTSHSAPTENAESTSGEWLAPYTGTVVTDPGKLDIDHMVPLGNAHCHRCFAVGPQSQRERYANYLDHPQHLIAVTASANRSKGARGPEEWRPEDQFLLVPVRHRLDHHQGSTWELTVTQAEHDALVQMLNTCSDPPSLWVSHGSIPGQHRPTATPELRVTATPAVRTYSSCDAAQAAGEHRVQGSKGSGQGLPEVDGSQRTGWRRRRSGVRKVNCE